MDEEAVGERQEQERTGGGRSHAADTASSTALAARTRRQPSDTVGGALTLQYTERGLASAVSGAHATVGCLEGAEMPEPGEAAGANSAHELLWRHLSNLCVRRGSQGQRWTGREDEWQQGAQLFARMQRGARTLLRSTSRYDPVSAVLLERIADRDAPQAYTAAAWSAMRSVLQHGTGGPARRARQHSARDASHKRPDSGKKRGGRAGRPDRPSQLRREAVAQTWQPPREGPAPPHSLKWWLPGCDRHAPRPPATADSAGPSEREARRTHAAALARQGDAVVQKAREAAHAIEAAHMAEAARAIPRAAEPLVTTCVRCEVPFPAECCPLALLRQPLQAARCPACYQDDMPEMPGYAGPFS